MKTVAEILTRRRRTISSLLAEAKRVREPLGYRCLSDAARFIGSILTDDPEEITLLQDAIVRADLDEAAWIERSKRAAQNYSYPRRQA